ncbi:MAG: DUF58 domain-containing protein [Desulfobacterales bacterium]|nr:DUF58 domain-containing protein [Desulfobacterales bacterium]
MKKKYKLSIVPSSGLLILIASIFIPVSIFMAISLENTYLWLCLAISIFITVIFDALISKARLSKIYIIFPNIIRLSKGKEGIVNVFIQNTDDLKLIVRVGIGFPKEIIPLTYDIKITIDKSIDKSNDSQFSINWPCIAIKQGYFLMEECYVETLSFIGLWNIRGLFKGITEIRVYPNLHNESKKVKQLLSKNNIGYHLIRQIGKGKDFEQLREYMEGDSYDDICWKATAKRMKPVTKVYQIEKTQNIYLAIDNSRLSSRILGRINLPQTYLDSEPYMENFILNTSILQKYIECSLVMGAIIQKQGDMFGLIVFSDRVKKFIKAKNGKTHYNACMDLVYTLDHEEVNPDYSELFSFIGTNIRRRSLIIVLTNLDDALMAENFIKTSKIIKNKHIIIANMLKSSNTHPLFMPSNPIQTIDEVYSHLAGHFLWANLKNIEKILNQHGIGFSMLKEDTMSIELISQYFSVKQRQAL